MTKSSFKIVRICEPHSYENYQCLKCMFIKITKAHKKPEQIISENLFIHSVQQCPVTALVQSLEKLLHISSFQVFYFFYYPFTVADLSKQEPQQKNYFLPQPWSSNRRTTLVSKYSSAIYLSLNEEKHLLREYSCHCSAHSYH